MKTLIAIMLVAELLVAVFIFAPFCVLRDQQLRAFRAWHDTPTPETRAELEKQSRITELYRFGVPAIAFCVMGSATLLVARSWKRARIARLDPGRETWRV